MKLRRKFFWLFALIISGYSGCFFKPSEKGVLKIKGSDTMLFLTSALAKEFMKKNPSISIYVEGGGTKTGIDALVKGKIDICTASRNLKFDEIQVISEEFRSVGVTTLIAKDALSIFLNPKNPVKKLSLNDVRNIFTCKITNWKEIGGNDKSIRVLNRSLNSGTYLYFKEHVLMNEDYCYDIETIPTTEEIIKIVSQDESAVGYGGIGYADRIIHAAINDVYPTEQNVRNEKYPISRYLMFITLTMPADNVKKFIDWVLSPGGQMIVKQAGFIPLWERNNF